MKKVKLFCKTTLALATMLLGVGNAIGANYSVDWTASNSASFTDERGVAFNISGDFYFNSSAYKIDKGNTASISWTAPDGYVLTVNGITLDGQSAGSNFGAEISSDKLSDTKQIVLNFDRRNTSTVDSKYLGTGATTLSIRSKGRSTFGNTTQIFKFSISYELVSVVQPNIIVKDANVTNSWHNDLAFDQCVTLVNDPQNVDVNQLSGENVASYNSERNVFVLGHESGEAEFSISADGVEAKTFTITANQSFYAYAKDLVGESVLAETHNQTDAESAIASYRASQMENLSGTDVTINYMIDNRDFQYTADWDYGWTGTTDETKTGDGEDSGNQVMNAYQKYDNNGNLYPYMYRKNWGLNNRTIKTGDLNQNVTLPAGYYRLGADIECYKKGSGDNLVMTLYAKSGDNTLASKGKTGGNANGFETYKIGFALSTQTDVKIGAFNNSVGGSSEKGVAADNFSLTYVCDKATYDAYMEQYNRANGLKDNPKLLTALNTALKEAQKDILTLAGATIADQTVTLKNACDAAAAHINWVSENVKEVVNKNNMYLHLYPHADAPLSVLSRGADYGTRAIVTNSGLKLNVETNNETLLSTVTFRDTNKKLFVTTDNAVYTDYDNSGEANFYFVSVEGGYKIVCASDHNKALYVKEEGENKVVMPTTLDNADIWYFANEISASVSISDAEWATYYNSEWAFIVPEGLTAVVVIKDNDNIKLVKDVYTEGETVPACEAVLLNGEAGPYTLNFVVSSASPYVGNLLKGSDNVLLAAAMEETANPDENYFYGLSLNAEGDVNSIGFYWMKENGAAFDNAAHKAYLVLPKSSNAPARFVFGQPGVATAVENANLSTADGKKVMMNGVLYIVRDGKTYDSFGRMVK